MDLDDLIDKISDAERIYVALRTPKGDALWAKISHVDANFMAVQIHRQNVRVVFDQGCLWLG